VIPCTTKISEVLETMRSNNTGFVLLSNSTGNIQGIFTQSDVIKKIETITDPESLERQIGVIMSQPLKYLTVDMMHTCAEFMVENNISHVPIFSRKKELIGVITADTVLKSLVHYSGMPPIYSGKGTTDDFRLLGVLSPDGAFYNYMKSIFENSDYLGIDRLYFGNMQEPSQLKRVIEQYDALIIDIDEAPRKEFIHILREFLETPEIETVGLLYDPKKQDSDLLDVINKLKVSGQFHVYTKPVHIVNLIADLNDAWNIKSKSK